MKRIVWLVALAASLVAISPLVAKDGGGWATLMVTGIADYEKDYAFYVYYPGAMTDTAKIVDDWWRRVETHGVPAGKPVHVEPPTLGYGSGDLALIAVPKKLADANPAGDASWFKDEAPSGILRVKGELKVVVLYSRHGGTVLDYRLDRHDGEFALTLLNPDRLAREHEDDTSLVSPAAESNSLWFTIIIGVGVLLLLIAGIWGLRRSPKKRG